MKDLIAKLEAIKEGTSQLDEDIGLAIGWERVGEYNERWHEPGVGLAWTEEFIPEFTTSLDAALRLILKGCRYSIEQSICGRWFDATVFNIGEADKFIGDTPQGMASAALAVCVAALYARISMGCSCVS